MELQSAVKLEYRVLRINKSLCCPSWPLATGHWPADHWECVVIAKNELFNLALLYGQKHPFFGIFWHLKKSLLVLKTIRNKKF